MSFADSLAYPGRVAGDHQPPEAAASGLERGALVGTKVGRYRVLALVGAGGMGEVYTGHDPILDRPVAIKRLRPREGEDDDRARRLRMEAQMHGRLRHPNIVRVYDFVRQAGADHIITEHVDGQSLRELMAAGRPPFRRGLEIMLAVARGLSFAHDNQIVHRDLKSENVLVGSDDGVKITDFGISRSLTPLTAAGSHASEAGILVGTFQNMSPEQSFGTRVDARSDLFSLGIVAYEVFAGHSPFEDKTIFDTLTNIRKVRQTPLAELAPDVTVELSDLVDRLLAKEPQARPSSAKYVVDMLERLLAETIETETPSDQGRRQQVAVAHLSLHVHGSSPERELAKFHEMVRNACKQFRALLVYAVGEEALVCLGYPEVHETNTRAAAELVFDLFARISLADEGAKLELRAAVDVGEVTVHQAGTSRLMTGTPVSRVMKIGRTAAAGEFLASAAAHLPLARFYHLESRPWTVADELPLCYAVVGEQTIENTRTTFVGRADELSMLRRAWDAVADQQRGQVLVLEGEAGIGKSRLVNHFLTDRAFEGRELTTRATPNGRFRPFDPFRRLFGWRNRTEVESQVRVTGPHREEVIAAIAHILGTANDGDTTILRRIEKRDGSGGIAAKVAWFLLGLAEEHSLLLVFEDLHWADHSSRMVIDELVKHVHKLPMCVVLTHRPEYQPSWRADNVSRLTLDRLGEGDATKIVEQCFGDKSHPPSVTDQVLAKALGVPLWLEELASAVALRVQGGATPSELVPPTLRDSVQSRLQTVGPETRGTAELLAAIGREIPPDLLFAVAGREHREREEDIEALKQQGLIQQRGLVRKPMLVFRHALMRDAIYAGIEEQDRRRIHEAIIGALHSQFPEWGRERPELFACHYEAAGDYDHAVRFLQRAAARAAEMSSHDLACRHCKHALRLLPKLADGEARNQLELSVRLAYRRSLQIVKGLWTNEIEETSVRIKAIGCEPSAEDLWMAFLQAYLLCSVSKIDALLGQLEERTEDPLLRYLLLTMQGMAGVHRGQLSQARTALGAAVELRREVASAIDRTFQETTLIVAPHNYVAWIEMLAGDREAAMQHHRSFEAESSANSTAHLNSLAMGAVVTALMGNHRETRARTERVVAEGEGVLAPGHVCIARFLHLYTRQKQGEPEALTPDAPHELWQHFLGWHKGTFLASSIVFASMAADVCVDVMKNADAAPATKAAARIQAQTSIDWGLDRIQAPDVDAMHKYIAPDFYRTIGRLAAVEGDAKGADVAFAEAFERCEGLAQTGGESPRFLMDRVRRSRAE